VTTKRKNAKATSEAPITGVAAGSLGTAANLDDTKVMRMKDLQAAAAAWLDDDGAEVASEPGSDVIPVEELAPRQTARDPRQRPLVTQSEPVPAQPVLGRRNPSVPALAGVAALFVLLLIAGSGFFSQLDLGTGAGPGPEASANALIEAAPFPTAEPTDAAKGHGKCHGRGHGDCQGTAD
jgi:hypothetical protein